MKRDKIHLSSYPQSLEVRRVFGSQRLWVFRELRFRMCFVLFQVALSWNWQVSYSKTWASWCLREEREWRSKSAGVDSFLKSHHVMTRLPNKAVHFILYNFFCRFDVSSPIVSSSLSPAPSDNKLDPPVTIIAMNDKVRPLLPQVWIL